MLKKYLQSIFNITVHHTVRIFVGVIILTFVLGYQARSLQFQTSFNYILSDNNPRIKTFNEILNAFENDSNILLIASGSEDSLRSFAYHIKPILESFNKWISSVQTQIPDEFLRKNVMKLTKLNKLDNFREIFSDPNLVPFLFNLNNAFVKTYLQPHNRIISKRDEQDAVEFLDRLQMFIRAQEDILLETEAVDVGQKAVDAIVFGESLRFTQERDMLLIIIEPGFNMDIPIGKLLKNVNGIEEIIEKTAILHGIRSKLGGPLVKARDHYTAFLAEFWPLFILSLAGLCGLLILFFRILSIPIICLSTLVICVLWTLGIYSFFMNSINLISILAIIIFILLGLGYCILLFTGFMEKRKQGLNIEVSIQETLQCFGSGIIISGSVVGVVFLTLILSKIKVCQDLGIMAGLGIITTMIVTIFLIPSMLIIREKLFGNNDLVHPAKDISYRFLGNGAQWIAKYRWVSIIAIFFITGFIFHQGVWMYKDTNLSNISLHDLDTNNVEDVFIKSFGISSSLITFTTDNLDTARRIAEESRELVSSGFVESITDYLPDEEFNVEKFLYLRELRRKIISRKVRKQLSSYDINLYRKEIERLEANIIELQDISLLQDQVKVYNKTLQLVGNGADSSFQGILTPFINALDTGMNRLKLTYFQEQFSAAFKSTIIEMANTEPLTLENLPLELKARFMGENDSLFRINIYPHNNIWDNPAFFDSFVYESSSLNDKITGWPVLFVELKDRINYYGLQSIQLIVFSLILLLMLSLRSFKYSLIILASISAGVIWLMGIMIFCNNPLRLMNIWIVPVILSIGINNGIQIIQRWKKEENLDTVYRSTGKGILVTAFTIFIIWLPFSFTHYTYLMSITSVFLIGLGCSLLVQLIILPPFLYGKKSR